MDTYRLFVAIDLPETIKDQLVALQSGVGSATWVKRYTFHLTLRFLGDGIPAAQLDAITTALAQLEAPPFAFHLQGVGRFPPGEKRGARVLWVGIAPQPLLTGRLQPLVEQAVTGIGFPPDDKPFSGHITMARLKKPDALAQDVPRWLAQHSAFRSDAIPVESFTLYSSLLTPQGPRYSREAVFSLKG